MKHLVSKSIFTLIFTLLSVVVIAAQGTCSDLIEEALTSVEGNCENLDRNNACYGFDLVQAAFLNEVPDNFFTLPADVADILDIETIATAGLDEESGTWGIAVMSIQANLPNTLPGQSVTFVLMGDTEVENAVEPEDVFTPSDGIEVTVAAADGANVRSGPGFNFNVVSGALFNTTLAADGQSADGDWLRVVNRNRPAWINKSVLAEDSAMNDLPVLSPELKTSMQAFYLRTGIGRPTCEGVPDDLLMIQGPDGIDIEFTVNGANVTIGSTVGLRIVEIDGQQFLELIVFDGHAEVGGVTVQEGYSTLMCLSEADDRGLDGESNDRIVTCDPSTPQPVENFGEQWCYLEEVPASLLNYSVEILCPGETPPPVVSTGGSTKSNSTATDSQVASVDCSTFHMVGPFEGITPRPTTFYWTEAPGATKYEIVFYSYEGNVAGTFPTSDTNITLNVGQIPTGSEMQWEVRAYGEEGYACVTTRTPMIFRLADPEAEPPESDNFTARKTNCSWNGEYHVTIRWSGLKSGETVRLILIDNADSSNRTSVSGSGESGRLSATLDSNTSVKVHVRTSDGENVNLGKCEVPL